MTGNGATGWADTFDLRFPLEHVQSWSDGYIYADSAEVQAIGAVAGQRGWYTRDEFLTVMLWKTARTKSRCAQNKEEEVIAATKMALATRDERVRMRSLNALRGVAYPTASTLLHFARPDAFPIIDVRALWSLGINQRPLSYSFDFWWDYVEACRALAQEAGSTLRVLDRALWQYSKVNQPRIESVGERSRVRKGREATRSGPNKSEAMRRLYRDGQSVAQVAKSIGVGYAFAYGVRKRWLETSATSDGRD
jgi:hypothetical protein